MRRFTLIDRSDFRLLQRLLLEGDAAIRPVLAQRRDLGFNCARVFSQCDLMWRLHPGDFHASEYDDAVIWLIELLAEYGSYINCVVYADERNINSGPNHWNRLGALMQAKSGCGILSAVNEADQAVNTVPFLSQLQKIDGVICTRGSNGGGSNLPPLPHMDAGEVHTNGQDQEWRKDHNPMEDIGWPTNIPAWVSEHSRPDQGTLADPGRYGDCGGIGALLCAGSTFHAAELKYSDLLGPSIPQAKAFVARMRAIPADFLGGCTPEQYRRIDDSSVLRRYRKTLSDGRSWEETARLP